jgi:hypothetical protein
MLDQVHEIERCARCGGGHWGRQRARYISTATSVVKHGSLLLVAFYTIPVSLDRQLVGGQQTLSVFSLQVIHAGMHHAFASSLRSELSSEYGRKILG